MKVVFITFYLLFKYENGTIVGMLSEIASGLVDTSVASFSYTLERSEFMDFSLAIDKMVTTVFIRRPKSTDITVSHHTKEFLLLSWLSVIVFYIVVILSLFLVTSNKQTFIEETLEISLKAFIAKVIQTFLPQLLFLHMKIYFLGEYTFFAHIELQNGLFLYSDEHFHSVYLL